MRLPPAVAVALLVMAAFLSPATARGDIPNALLLRLHADGPHAVRACMQGAFETGTALRGATADGSSSLDRVHERARPQNVRAVFRRADGRPLAEQRARLARRLRDGGRSRRAARALPEALPDLSHIYRVRLAPDADLEAALALYRADPHVAWVQPDAPVVPEGLPADWPDDPFFLGTGAWGQPYRDLWGLEQIDVEGAWQISRGEGVVVGVVDSGLDYEHPDIAANVWVNPGEDLDANGRVDEADYNGIDDDENGFIDDLRGFDFANSVDANEDGDYEDAGDVSDSDPRDQRGHGSHLAGTIAAVADNGIGLVGVAPESRIMPVQIYSASGGTPASTVWRAVLYAAENGADVINAAFSCGGRCPSNPIAEETVRAIHALGVVLVTSAGNRADDVVHRSPEGSPEVLTVASSNPDGELSGFSNFGWQVDVLAPGGGPSSNILSIRAEDTVGNDATPVGEGYERRRGTSMASAHLSGVVALLLGARPELDVDAVRAILRGSAFDDDAPGHDRRTAAGRVDAAAALSFEPAAVVGRIVEPAAGAILNTQVGTIEVRGTAAGPDLAHWSLFVGTGSEPEVWEPLVTSATSEVVDGLLASWPVAALVDGIRVLRLELVTRDGDRIEEFAPLGLERNTPVALTPEDRLARMPALSEDHLVWQQRRRNEEGVREFRMHGVELSGGAALSLEELPVNPEPAVLSGRLLAWQDVSLREGGAQQFAAEISACWIQKEGGPCGAVTIASGDVVRSAPIVSGRTIVWSEVGERRQIYGCIFDEASGACPARQLAPHETGSQQLPALSGRRLVWVDSREGRPQLFGCDLDAELGGCVPHPIETGRSFHFSPVVSGSIIAFEDFVGTLGALVVCEIEAASLAEDTWRCPGVELVRGHFEYQPALSGRRLSWQVRVPLESDVWFCHYDSVMRECTPQRLTGIAALQAGPAIEGQRVVFEDERNGVAVIRSLELPDIVAPQRISTRNGRAFVARLKGSDPMGGPIVFEAKLRDGGMLAGLGAELVQTGSTTAELRWPSGAAMAGAHRVTFTARTTGGLEAVATSVIEVPEPAASALAAAAFAVLIAQARARRGRDGRGHGAVMSGETCSTASA